MYTESVSYPCALLGRRGEGEELGLNSDNLCVNTGFDGRQECFSLPVITCNLLLLSLLSEL